MEKKGNRNLLALSGLFSMFLLTVLIFASSTCATEKPATTLTNTPVGQSLYTQFSMFYEHNVHRTTNYRKGVLVPVNTVVKFAKYDSFSITVTLPDGQQLVIQNVQNYSGENIDGIFARTFSTRPVDLSVFTETERQSIMAGEVQQGMGKSAVIVALGYPPKHKTPNLQLDQWQYWKNRFNTFIVYFEKDKVSRVQD